MTLIIGIKCSDGIVIGADGAATLGALGQQTVRLSARKLFSIDKKIIVGVSGPVGLGQRITGVMENLWYGNKLGGAQKSFEVMTVIRKAIGEHIAVEMHYASEVSKLFGQGIAALSAVSSTVMALHVDGELRLYQFGCAGEPEEATENLPFVSVGSAQARADPFLAFIRQVFWKNAAPTISQGIFATVWSLVHAIRTDPGGVAEPIQLMTLTKDAKSHSVAKEFDIVELQEHRQAVEAAEQYISEFPVGVVSKPTPEPPKN
jgi:20S proteasome alpha/beta subunit